MRRSTGAVGALAAAIGLVSGAPAAAEMSVGANPCPQWSAVTVAAGYGMLENLAFDGQGSMLLSESALVGPGAVRALDASGARSTLVENVNGPGGLVLVGEDAYFTTGNTALSGLLGIADGTIDAVDLGTGDRRTLASGLVMPNGLTRLGNGDLLTTRDLGAPGLTRIPAERPGSPELVRADLGTVNGIATHGDRVYVSTSFDPVSELKILSANDLHGPVRTIPLPGVGPLNIADDLTVGPDGAVYVTYNLPGKVLRVDTATGTSCEIASGLTLTSSVQFGAGRGWDEASLYATGFDGTVRQLIPPVR
ncbi:SMP-30/gluconolactonase/LRE family protein [Rhodococcus xishaensis]|uniref:SMP-30/Gluconolactonase/LRE-like region domain-containing protein n=1 Tax=Rhodococcus xishaensis TaxID=2487364 RepID=A0A3S3B8X8_9NOCA|nr:hypothetical protein [Rhodococcus xishaensis]RVW05843.1 hypothetical protein EGT50_02255 [Rhodococcus xishaensis]